MPKPALEKDHASDAGGEVETLQFCRRFARHGHKRMGSLLRRGVGEGRVQTPGFSSSVFAAMSAMESKSTESTVRFLEAAKAIVTSCRT